MGKSLDEIRILLSEAIVEFNAFYGSEFSTDNVMIDAFDPSNAKEVYLRFTSAYGFTQRDVSEKSFEGVGAESFVGGMDGDRVVDGIMIRDDMEGSASLWLYTIERELAYIFCIRNEIEGGGFVEKYCLKEARTEEEHWEGEELRNGYIIWRHLVVDIMAGAIRSELPRFAIKDLEQPIAEHTAMIVPQNPNAIAVLASTLSIIHMSQEAVAGKANDVMDAVKDMGFPFLDVLKLTLMHAKKKKLTYKITTDFIRSLGRAYLSEMDELEQRAEEEGEEGWMDRFMDTF